MSFSIPLSKPWISESEYAAVEASLRSGWITQAGKYVGLVENHLTSFLSNPQAPGFAFTTCSNGTTALHLALLAAGVKEGDEVVIPNFCYIAVANSVIYVGAKPVLVDVDLNSWCININQVNDAITPKTKAIIAVDNYGFPASVKELKKLIPESVVIIQDAAESFPGSQKSKNSWFGDLVTFSFYANKVITSGEGGGIWASSETIKKINSLKSQANEISGTFRHTGLGYNYRITNMQAALLDAQIKRLDEILEKRSTIFAWYEDKLVKPNGLKSNADANPWLFTVELPLDSDTEYIRKQLAVKGVETRPGFTPLSEHPHIHSLANIQSDLGVSSRLSRYLISLPTFPEMTEKYVDFISANLEKELRKI